MNKTPENEARVVPGDRKAGDNATYLYGFALDHHHVSEIKRWLLKEKKNTIFGQTKPSQK